MDLYTMFCVALAAVAAVAFAFSALTYYHPSDAERQQTCRAVETLARLDRPDAWLLGWSIRRPAGSLYNVARLLAWTPPGERWALKQALFRGRSNVATHHHVALAYGGMLVAAQGGSLPFALIVTANGGNPNALTATATSAATLFAIGNFILRRRTARAFDDDAHALLHLDLDHGDDTP